MQALELAAAAEKAARHAWAVTDPGCPAAADGTSSGSAPALTPAAAEASSCMGAGNPPELSLDDAPECLKGVGRWVRMCTSMTKYTTCGLAVLLACQPVDSRDLHSGPG